MDIKTEQQEKKNLLLLWWPQWLEFKTKKDEKKA